MKTKRLKTCLFVCFILFTTLYSGCKNETGISPKVGTITESVYASGKVKADEQYKVISNIAGILIKKHVKVGDSVKKGDPVFTLKNPVAEFTIQNSELALKRAKENFTKIKELERQAELVKNKYLQDSAMFFRQKNLWNQQIGTKVQVEQTELAMKSSKTEYSNIISQLKQTKATLQFDYETAKNNVKIAKENADGYIIRSETDGKVYTIYPETGEGVTPQSVLAIIGNQDRFLIEIQVDENDIARIQPGQEIFVSMDSYKDSVYKARITRIYPIMNESTGTFTVEGIFIKAPERLYPQLNLEANILIGQKQNVIIIPREYLSNDNYVLLENGNKIQVEVGLKNYEFAEIVSGLNQNQVIVKP